SGSPGKRGSDVRPHRDAGIHTMRPLLSLIRREFAAYFLSPIAYATLILFLGVLGYLFGGALAGLTETGPDGLDYPVKALLGADVFWLVSLFIPPRLTLVS